MDSASSPLISTAGPSGPRDTILLSTIPTNARIETLPGNKILVVAPHCFLNEDGSHEPNAKIYLPDGERERQFLVGSGISHVQSDADGNVWVGYADQAVFGDFGRGSSGGPFGPAGLSCFSPIGGKIWDFKPPSGFNQISHCYALNVSRGGVWAYYYTDFPIAWIDSDWHVRCWNTRSADGKSVAGGRTFAAGNEKILLYGGYGNRRNSCSFLRLQGTDAELVAQVSLVLPRDAELANATVIGRDKELHVFSGDDWYVFSVDSLG
ncbi:MAG: hypothetical protein WBL70_08765 [Candidatus Acidiferrales bacterium]